MENIALYPGISMAKPAGGPPGLRFQNTGRAGARSENRAQNCSNVNKFLPIKPQNRSN